MRKHCDTCIRDDFGDYCKHCEWAAGKPPSKWKPVEWWTPDTNADRIRAMSDEELAEYFAEIGNDASNGISYSENPEEWLEWLKQPAEVIENA